jgi:hypothetical protein
MSFQLAAPQPARDASIRKGGEFCAAGIRQLSLAPVYSGTLIVEQGGGGDFEDIQLAIDGATDRDTVVVKPGEYVIEDTIDFSGKAITVRAEKGHGAQDTVIRMVGVGPVVSFARQEGLDSVLKGFTLTGGNVSRGYGGGVQCEHSSPTLADCTITKNSVTSSSMGYGGYGGGIYCKGSSPILNRCTITANSAANDGGGMNCTEGSHPKLTNCVITENSAGKGGGVCCYSSSPTFTECTLSANAAGAGAALYSSGSSSPILTGCTIARNESGWGAICCRDSSPTVTDCAILENSATEGGGIFCEPGSSPAFTGCTAKER